MEGWTRQSESDIWLVRLGVAERIVIGSDSDNVREVCPQFSPDGTRLSYLEGPANADDDDVVAVVIVAHGRDRPAGGHGRSHPPGWLGQRLPDVVSRQPIGRVSRPRVRHLVPRPVDRAG